MFFRKGKCKEKEKSGLWGKVEQDCGPGGHRGKRGQKKQDHEGGAEGGGRAVRTKGSMVG